MTIRFTAGSTSTFTARPQWDGATITSITAAQHFLVFTGGFPFASNNVTVSYSNALPLLTWYAMGASVAGGNNAGWVFGSSYVGTLAQNRLPMFLSHDDNEAAKSTATLAATSANASYPASNLKLERITKVWRTVAGVLSSVDVTIDCGSAKAVNLVAVGNHNVTSAGTVTIEAGSTTAYADFFDVIPWREFDMFLRVSQTYRYWRFRFTDAANPDNFIEAGSVVVGIATVPATAFSHDWQIIDEFENRNLSSTFGVANVDELFSRVRIPFQFTNKIDTEMDVIRAVFKDAKKDVVPLWFVPRYTDAYYVRFYSAFSRKKGVNNYDTVPLGVVEESRGNKIGA